MIQHLILSGGGVFGFSCYGALRECVLNGVFSINELRTIHATSVGSMLGVLLSLNYDWNMMDEFMVKRPWNQVFNVNFNTICSSIDRRGLFDRNVFCNIFKPLLEGKELSVDITLEEFYKFTGIDLHCYSTEINAPQFRLIDFSYSTHPHWKLIDVIYCSCCLPILFSPFIQNDDCFVDGGFLENYPLKSFVETMHPDNVSESETDDWRETVLGVCKCKSDQDVVRVDQSSNLLDYILYIIQCILTKLNPSPSTLPPLKYEINIQQRPTNLYDVYMVCSCMEERKRLIESGKQDAKRMLPKLQNSPKYSS